MGHRYGSPRVRVQVQCEIPAGLPVPLPNDNAWYVTVTSHATTLNLYLQCSCWCQSPWGTTATQVDWGWFLCSCVWCRGRTGWLNSMCFCIVFNILFFSCQIWQFYNWNISEACTVQPGGDAFVIHGWGVTYVAPCCAISHYGILPIGSYGGL